MNKNKRTNLILYTTATCNLNCTYCFIDKNPALQKIDKYLEDSFLATPNYYIEFAKEMFLKDKLDTIQIWGGEPFLAMHRAYYTIDKSIEYFSNLKKFMVSTNMVSPQFLNEFWGLIEVLGKHPDRQFIFNLQLSCDGPAYINDTHRGIGVTEKIQIVFKQLIEESQNKLPKNVKLQLHFKPTLDSFAIEQLQSKEKVMEYFLFFEDFQSVFNTLNKRENLIFNLPVPNTACPSPHTKQDGVNFANYCKITREIEKSHSLKYYKRITSFDKIKPKNFSPALNNVCMGHCGNGRTALGLLPDNKVSCCHNGFVDMLAEYKLNVMSNQSTHMDTTTIEKGLFTNSHNALCFDRDSQEFQTYQKRLEEFYDCGSKVKVGNAASIIILLAQHGQIDRKYIEKAEAIDAACFVLRSTAFCVRDNLGSTGNIYTYPLGLFKLLLNGAREYIEMEKKEEYENI